MIEKLLNKFGYFKQDNEDILKTYVENLPDMDGEFSLEDEKELMIRLNNVDGLKKWINFVIHRDTKNYYSAIGDKQRDIVRGASQRMLDLLKRMASTEKPKQEVTRISGIRYGS